MKVIKPNLQEQTEYEFLGWMINYPRYLLTTNVKSDYFTKKENADLFKILQTTYQTYNNIDTANLMKNPKMNFVLFNEASDITETQLCIPSKVDEVIPQLEATILDSYKIRALNELGRSNAPVDEYLKKLRELENINARPNEKGILTTKDVDISSSEMTACIKSGTTNLDKAIRGFKLGQMSVWSGSNGSAKSTYLNQIAINSIAQGYNVAMYSGELEPKRLLEWLFKQLAGKKRMRFNPKEQYWYVPIELKQRLQEELNNKLFIYNNNLGNKPDEIINQLRTSIKEHNVKVIIIDNLMSIDLTGYGDNQFAVQSQFTQRLVDLCKQEQVHIHFVCHPRKTTTFLRKNDISGTADITNKADNVFILHRVNNDFRRMTKEMFRWAEDYPIYKFTNVVEVCKCRDYGIEDYFVGMYYDPASKRLMNEEENDDKQ